MATDKPVSTRTSIMSMLVVILATLALLTSPQVARADELQSAVVGEGALQTQSGKTLWLGSPDDKTYNAVVYISGVRSGSANYVLKNKDEMILSLNNIDADQILIHSDKAQNTAKNFKKIDVSVSGNCRVSQGISVTTGFVTESMKILGDGTGSLTIDNASFGITVKNKFYTGKPNELVLSGLDVRIPSPENSGIYLAGGDLKLISGSLSITNAKSSFAIYAQSYTSGASRYGGNVIVTPGYSLTCGVDFNTAGTSTAIYATSMSNDPSSLNGIVGALPYGASFDVKGKHYSLVSSGGSKKALAADGSRTPAQVAFGYIIYDNALYSEDKPAEYTPANGDILTTNDGNQYVVTNAEKRQIYFNKASKTKKSVTVFNNVYLNDVKYTVRGISKNAFKGAKATKVTVKANNLKKTTVKKCLTQSKVKTIKVPSAKKATYKKIFVKSNCGKKVTVK